MRQILLLIGTLTAFGSYGQFGISYHQSNLPFAGFNYEIAEKWRPEIRIGTDTFLEDISFEGVVSYDILDRESYEFYAGAGIRYNWYTGIVVPVGVNIYPFAEKHFGFQMELAPVISGGNSYNSNLLRGSWGIRYRFGRSESSAD